MQEPMGAVSYENGMTRPTKRASPSKQPASKGVHILFHAA